MTTMPSLVALASGRADVIVQPRATRPHRRRGNSIRGRHAERQLAGSSMAVTTRKEAAASVLTIATDDLIASGTSREFSIIGIWPRKRCRNQKPIRPACRTIDCWKDERGDDMSGRKLSISHIGFLTPAAIPTMIAFGLERTLRNCNMAGPKLTRGSPTASRA